jgi:hypothetical protein
MEDLIDLYQRPSNPKVPVICMDEQPLQLIKEVRIPLSMAPNRPVRYDYEYQRNGTANAFLFTEPLNGWRRVSIRERKTRRDWAVEIRTLLAEDYPEAERVLLVCDNLNTQTPIPRGRSTKPSPGGGSGTQETPGNPSDTKIRQLAQYCRDRTQCIHATMPEPQNRGSGGPPERDKTLGNGEECQTKRGRSAVYDSRGQG